MQKVLEIKKIVSNVFNVEIDTKGRNSDQVAARVCFVRLVSVLTNKSVYAVCGLINRDHATCTINDNKFSSTINASKRYSAMYQRCLDLAGGAGADPYIQLGEMKSIVSKLKKEIKKLKNQSIPDIDPEILSLLAQLKGDGGNFKENKLRPHVIFYNRTIQSAQESV